MPTTRSCKTPTNFPRLKPKKLSESGNPYAKLRSALDNIPYEREKSVSEIRELYEKRGLRLAGYYLSNFLKDKAEREKLLEKLAAEGDDYACSAAKCDLLFDNLKASADDGRRKKIQRRLRQPIGPCKRRIPAGGSKASRFFYRDKLRQNKKFLGTPAAEASHFIWHTLARIERRGVLPDETRRGARKARRLERDYGDPKTPR